MIDIQIVPVLEDNYSYILRSPCGAVAVVDPGAEEPVIRALEDRGLGLDYILNTHHHWDHVNGNLMLKNRYGAQIVAPLRELGKIKNVDITLNDGDFFTLGEERARIIETAGHTLGGICYYFVESSAIFTGDTLFSLGCGRLFEGSAHDMFQSFEKLKALPDDTNVYCGHEYTMSNAAFCIAEEPENEALKARIEHVKALHDAGKPSIPSLIGLEKQTNVFMKAQSAEEFAALRQRKDCF